MILVNLLMVVFDKKNVTNVSLFFDKRINFVLLKILSKILSFILTSIIILNSLQVSLTYAYYNIDTVGFIEKLCENKDIPELQCHGKCHLKKLVDNNTNNDKEPVKAVNLKDVTLYVVEFMKYDFNSVSFKNVQLGNYNNLYAFSFIDSLDRPPQT